MCGCARRRSPSTCCGGPYFESRAGGRAGRVFAGLVGLLARHCRERGYDLAVLSGTVRQRKLYVHLGCVSFGPLIGTLEALYQPMYLTREAFPDARSL